MTGCGVRLEDDAPQIPFIPTREPIPAEEALLWLLADCRRLSAVTGEPPTTVADARAVYAEQVSVLRSALHRAGVPIETLDDAIATVDADADAAAASPDPTAPSAATATPSESTATSAATTAAAATTTGPATTAGPTTPPPATTPAPWPGAALDRIEDLRECGPGLFPLVMSMLAQRWGAVAQAGDPLPEPMLENGSGRVWRYPALARGFASLTEPAVYALEVAAAQAGTESRENAASALETVRRLRREQGGRAGGSTPPPQIGYALPIPVNSEETAAALARQTLSTLLDGYGGLLTTVTGSAQEDTARDVVTWIGTVAVLGGDWGLPLQAFPGTSPGS
jgi:hypothetical protein